MALYSAIYRYDIEKVQSLLNEGADPNYCHGEVGWVDENPLDVLSRGFFNTYYKYHGKPETPPDVEILQLLLKVGANVNARPYIWHRINCYDNGFIDSLKIQRKFDKVSLELVDMKEQLYCFVADVNRLIEALLKAGADPDKPGHPYPFSYEAVKTRITDEQANEYFAQGTRAINIAIEKGILWESQVDLLLQYTNLDEESLKAAIRSNDPVMVEKINKLWEIQQSSISP